MSRHEVRSIGKLNMSGSVEAIGTHNVTVFVKNSSGKVLLCSAPTATLPHDADSGFAVGCLLINETSGVTYTNVGTATSANFDAQSTVTGGSVTSAGLAANSVNTAAIIAANVTSAKIASSAVVASKLKDTSIVSGKISGSAIITTKIAAANVTLPKLKYITAALAVASNTSSISVSSASFTGGVPILSQLTLSATGASALRVTKFSLTASTAKLSLSGATTHTGAAVATIAVLRA